jgi:ribosomal protein S18 acetylase RimI-like enzyme
MEMSINIRDAKIEDCEHIAALFLVASDGLAEYIWTPLVEPGEDLLKIGARRYARTNTEFSFQKCQIAKDADAVVGMMHGFPMTREPGFDIETVDPVLRPYAELEDYGSFYISAVAIYPTHRNRGIGTRLLDAAAQQARSLDLPRLSLICFEQNDAAMRLYHRIGFVEIDRRPLVPHPCLRYESGDAILMSYSIT